MSTLEVTCSRCEKKLRVRAEFAGRSTRCPGCSAPITIGSAPKPAALPARSDPEDRPRSRPRDADDEPRRPAADWKPVDVAFRREQTAVVFVLIGIVCDYFIFCLTRSFGQSGEAHNVFTIIVLLFGVVPSLVAAAFGLMARISALRPPPTSLARPSAVASLLCVLAALGSLLVLAFALLLSIDSREPMELAFRVAGGGLVLSVMASMATFMGFVTQVGIVRKSASVSRAVGRLSITVSICLLTLIGIGVLYSLSSELTRPTNYGGNPYGGYGSYRDHSPFDVIMLAILFPLALGVILILYHRLLAAGRRAVQSDLGARYDD